MGLSEYDKKVLEQLEQDLLGSDDSLGRKFSGAKAQPSNSAAKLIAGALVAIVGMSLLVFAAIAHVIAIGLIGFLVALAGVLVASASNVSKSSKTSGRAQKPAKSATYFEQRWENRRDQG
jgi:hypothetical protein